MRLLTFLELAGSLCTVGGGSIELVRLRGLSRWLEGTPKSPEQLEPDGREREERNNLPDRSTYTESRERASERASG